MNTVLPAHYLELEAIYAQLVASGVRTIAITSAVPGEGVSLLSTALARRAVAGGRKTLLVDFNLRRSRKAADVLNTPQLPSWAPADGSIREAARVPEGGEYALVAVPEGGTNQFGFRDLDKLRQTFADALGEFDLVIADTSPLTAINGNNVPAETVAAAVDGTILVVLAGRTSETAIRSAAERLKRAGATLSGVVFNDRFNPRLVDEVCREIDRLRWLSPRFCDWLKRRLRPIPVLSIEP